MTKYTMLLFLLTVSINFANAQKIDNPTFDKDSSYKALNIDYVHLTDEFTMFKITYTVQKYKDPNQVMEVCISKETCLQDVNTGKKYKLLKIKNIHECPRKIAVGKQGQQRSFDLYFEKIDNPKNLHHLLEPLNVIEENSFTIYNIIIL